MQKYEYRVIAAPSRGVKAKGINSSEARFSHALEDMMNTMASEGWEYQRAETLPSTERAGLTSTTTTWRNVLVFRRLVEQTEQLATAPEIVQAPSPQPLFENTAPVQTTPNMHLKPPAIVAPMHPDEDASQSEGASRMLHDNGVEELSEVSGISSSLKQLAANRSHEKSAD